MLIYEVALACEDAYTDIYTDRIESGKYKISQSVTCPIVPFQGGVHISILPRIKRLATARDYTRFKQIMIQELSNTIQWEQVRVCIRLDSCQNKRKVLFIVIC